MQRSFLFLAEGFEEIEALSVVDIMRRAGMDIKTVSITDSKEVTGAHGVTVKADQLFTDENMEQAEWLILPGGMPGASNLAAFNPLCTLLKNQCRRGGNIAAICAAPSVVLGPLGILNGRKATCYPGFEEGCEGAEMHDTPVVNEGRLITANGPAAAMSFALTIVSNSMGESEAQQVGGGMLFYPRSNHFFM